MIRNISGKLLKNFSVWLSVNSVFPCVNGSCSFLSANGLKYRLSTKAKSFHHEAQERFLINRCKIHFPCGSIQFRGLPQFGLERPAIYRQLRYAHRSPDLPTM